MGRRHARGGTAIAADPARIFAEAAEHHRAGRLDEADAGYTAYLDAVPHSVDARHLRGLLAAKRRDWEASVAFLTDALAGAGSLTDASADLYNNAALALREVGRLQEAHDLLQELLASYPDRSAALHNLAQVFKDAGRIDEAVATMRRACTLGEPIPASHAVLGELLAKQGRLNSAVAAFERAMAAGYTGIESATGLGNTLRLLGDLEGAIHHLRRALAFAPDWPPAKSNLAIALMQAGEFGESRRLHDEACAADPDDVTLHSNRAYLRLTAGDLPGAWDDWEWAIREGARGSHRQVAVPHWTNEDVSERTVMVYREQGVGDEILFASCYPDLVEAAAHCVIECDPRLTPLFARSFPRATVRAQTIDLRTATERLDPPDFDLAVPAGSLPRRFRPVVAAFPDRRSFLAADPRLAAAWAERLATHPGARIGISWRSMVQTCERRLEYTRLHEWGPILTQTGAHFVNLQYDDCERELLDAEQRFGVAIHRWPDLDLKNDFDGVAALMTQLDLVIAPRNSVAMLAGGLGVPALVVGNRWDWSDLGTDTLPWFPSVTLQYRHIGDEWGHVIAGVAGRVAGIVQDRSHPPALAPAKD